MSLEELKFFGTDEIQPKNTLDFQIGQIREIQKSWKLINDHGLKDQLGIRIMKAMFSIQPGLLNLFSFRDENDLYNSESLRKHASLVISALESLVDGLPDLSTESIKLKQLGERHWHYGVFKENYEIFGRSLIVSLDRTLKTEFTANVKSAWVTFFLVLSSYMVSDNYEQESQQNSYVFTPLKVKLIQDSWKKMQDSDRQANVTLFRKLIALDQSVIEVFQLGHVQDIYTSYELKRISSKILKALAHIVTNLQSWDSLQPLMQKLGTLHDSKFITKEHYRNFGKALFETLESNQ